MKRSADVESRVHDQWNVPLSIMLSRDIKIASVSAAIEAAQKKLLHLQSTRTTTVGAQVGLMVSGVFLAFFMLWVGRVVQRYSERVEEEVEGYEALP